MTDVVVDGAGLSIDDIVAVARGGARAVLSERARTAMQASRDVVEELAASGRPVYGVSTGFGSLADVYVEPESRARLQAALIRSQHFNGVTTTIGNSTVPIDWKNPGYQNMLGRGRIDILDSVQ